MSARQDSLLKHFLPVMVIKYESYRWIKITNFLQKPRHLVICLPLEFVGIPPSVLSKMYFVIEFGLETNAIAGSRNSRCDLNRRHNVILDSVCIEARDFPEETFVYGPTADCGTSRVRGLVNRNVFNTIN